MYLLCSITFSAIMFKSDIANDKMSTLTADLYNRTKPVLCCKRLYTYTLYSTHYMTAV